MRRGAYKITERENKRKSQEINNFNFELYVKKEDEQTQIMRDIIEEYCSDSDNKKIDIDILTLYANGHKMHEIALIMGVNKMYVSRSIKKTKIELQKILKKEVAT